MARPQRPVASLTTPDEKPPPAVCIFSPAPLLTITIELAAEGREELHLHPGGKGSGSPDSCPFSACVPYCVRRSVARPVRRCYISSKRRRFTFVRSRCRRRTAATSTIGAVASASRCGRRNWRCSGGAGPGSIASALFASRWRTGDRWLQMAYRETGDDLDPESDTALLANGYATVTAIRRIAEIEPAEFSAFAKPHARLEASLRDVSQETGQTRRR